MRPSSQSGMSILTVLVSMAIGTTVLLGMAEQLTRLMKGQKSIEMRGDKESIRQMLMRRMSCDATLANASAQCNSGQYFAILDAKSRVIAGSDNANGSKLGNWNLRASCEDNNIKIEIARFKNNSQQFAEDPLTNKPYSWSSLFASGSSPCDTSVATVQPTSVPTSTPTPKPVPTQSAFVQQCQNRDAVVRVTKLVGSNSTLLAAGSNMVETSSGQIYGMVRSGGGVGRARLLLRVDGKLIAGAVAYDSPNIDGYESQYIESDIASFNAYIPKGSSWSAELQIQSQQGVTYGTPTVDLCFLPTDNN